MFANTSILATNLFASYTIHAYPDCLMTRSYCVFGTRGRIDARARTHDSLLRISMCLYATPSLMRADVYKQLACKAFSFSKVAPQLPVAFMTTSKQVLVHSFILSPVETRQNPAGHGVLPIPYSYGKHPFSSNLRAFEKHAFGIS